MFLSLVETYEIRTLTGKEDNNGTKSNIFINIFGKKGDTGKRQLLHKNQNDQEKQFQQGKVKCSF